MICGKCHKEVMPDSYFCNWCSAFIPSPAMGTRANLFARWVALILDPLIAVFLYMLAVLTVGSIIGPGAIMVLLVFPFAYFIWFLTLLRQGLTPGKKLLGLQVVNCQTGQIPGFGKMFLREIIGRFLSAIFFSLGYIWALFDKNSQGWHDKLAGTVVLKKVKEEKALAPAQIKNDETASDTYFKPKPVIDIDSPEFIAKIDILKRRIEKDPLNAELSLQLGDVLMENQLFKEALIEYQKAIAIECNNSRAYIKSGDIYSMLGDFAKAQNSYSKALEVEPCSIAAKKGLFWIYARSNASDKALQIGEEIFGSDTGDIEFTKALGTLLLEQNHVNDAIKTLNRVIELDPRDFESLKSVALLCDKIGDKKSALGYFERAAALDPKDNECKYFQGKYCFENGEYEEAIGYLSGSVQGISQEHKSYNYLYLSAAYATVNKMELAEGAILKASFGDIEQLPEHLKGLIAETRAALGDYFAGKRQLKSAQKHYRIAYDSVPGSDKYRAQLDSVTREIARGRKMFTLAVLGGAITVIIGAGYFYFSKGQIGVEVNTNADIYVSKGDKLVFAAPNSQSARTELLRTGEYSIRIAKPGFDTIEKNISIGLGRKTYTVSLSMFPNFGSLKMRTRPSDARVFLDNQYVGSTPFAAESLLAKEIEIKIEKEGFNALNKRIAIIEDSLLNLEFSFNGFLSLDSRPSLADVYINNKKAGKTPLEKYELPATNVYLRIEVPGKAIFENNKLSILPEEEISLGTIELMPAGQLGVKVHPYDAEIYIDGVLRGSGATSISALSEGNHSIRISKSFYEAQTKDIRINGEELSNVESVLRQFQGKWAIRRNPRGTVDDYYNTVRAELQIDQSNSVLSVIWDNREDDYKTRSFSNVSVGQDSKFWAGIGNEFKPWDGISAINRSNCTGFSIIWADNLQLHLFVSEDGRCLIGQIWHYYTDYISLKLNRDKKFTKTDVIAERM